MRSRSLLAAAAVSVGVASLLVTSFPSPARAAPFLGGGGAGQAFDPEIGIVESGAILDTTATVSADRKYVTLTMRPQLSQLLALREFIFQTSAPGNPNNPAGGLVG